TNVCGPRTKKNILGFTLIETVVSIGIFGIMASSFFPGVSQNLSVVAATREDQRATQIMAEKMDTIRLYTWEQINTPGFIPTNFTVAFDPAISTATAQNGSGGGSVGTPAVSFNGTVSISQPAVTESYQSSLRQVTIDLTWQSGKATRQAHVTTFV